MTREEIIALAKQCGFRVATVIDINRLEAFFHAAQALEREKLQNELHDANMHIKQLERGFDKVISNRTAS